MLDVIAVGADPADSLPARVLADSGNDVEVLEEHPVPGLPQHCTGLVSDETMGMFGLRPGIINTMYGVDMVFPDEGRFMSTPGTRKEEWSAVWIWKGEIGRNPLFGYYMRGITG